MGVLEKIKENQALWDFFEDFAEDNGGKKLVADFMKSNSYRRYVETQVDGPALASALKFRSNTANDLHTLKVALLMGENPSADMLAEKLNVELRAKKGARDAVKFITGANIIIALKKITIKL